MRLFLLNLLLALTWATLTGTFTLNGLLVGFAIGFAALWSVQSLFQDRGAGYFVRVWRWLKLAALFVYELVVSSIQVAWEVLRLRGQARPGIVVMPLAIRGETQALLLTNLISLTPGTLSLDVTEDCDSLVFHAMFADDPEALTTQIADGFERLIREAVE